jgi:protease-4
MSGILSVLRRLSSVAKTSFAIVGLGTSVYAAKELHGITNAASRSNDDNNRKKNILVLPFHRMKIVEQKKQSLSSFIDRLSSKEDGIMEVGIQELVDAIHAAASDPNVVALHGTFGSGFKFQCGGYAHVEEIRNAIRLFNESHRRHYEGQHGTLDKANCDQDENAKPVKKMSYAFADSFDSPVDPGNKEYILASAFSQVNMQPRGNMQFFGVSMSNVFLSDAFKKYGIKAHVFKHGQYKNAPNSITESGYTKAHYENSKAILDSINESVHAMISHSRNLPKSFDSKVWKAVHNYGTMTADNAQEIKLIDNLPKVNPVFDLVKINACKEEDDTQSNTLREKWISLLDVDNFKADKLISFSDYSAKMKKEKRQRRQRGLMYDKVQYAVSRSTAFETIVDLLGFGAPYFNFDKDEVDNWFSKDKKDKIAVVYITGGIDDKTAKNVVRALQQVKNDKKIKCVVLRVDSPGGGVTASETILEECKDLGRPVVCSFSNLAASGGYYISAFSDRIFAQRTTLTGSIGVFGIKLDASEAARRHGVEFGYISSGEHAQTFSLFHPLNDAMKANLTRNMDRVYQYFKQLVSEGRNIPLAEVETLAQGRVWTGEQAKENDLIDEFGGINHAIAYATAKYTSGVAEVEIYPKPLSLKEKLTKASKMEMTNISDEPLLNSQLLLKSVQDGSLLTPCSVVLSMDETSATKTIIKEVCERLR